MKLTVHEWGPDDGRALVCLHGLRGHGRVFGPLAEQLAGALHVLAPDLRGHGRSDWEPPWDLETHVADVRETLADRRAIFVGHSFGARVVLELVAAAPELVERAVLLEPIVWAPPPLALEHAEGERPERVYASRDDAIAQRYVSSRLFSTPRALLERELDDHLVESEVGFRYRYCPSAVIAGFGELARLPPAQETLRVPTLVVRGTKTDVVPVEVLAWFAELGELLEVAEVDAGHHVLWDAFEETAAAIERFVR